MLNGMLWIAGSGAQWRELPEAYGPWQSVYARFAKWRDDGTLETMFRALSEDADMENLSIDSTCIKVHESANSGEKTEDKAVGRVLLPENQVVSQNCRQIRQAGRLLLGLRLPCRHCIPVDLERLSRFFKHALGLV